MMISFVQFVASASYVYGILCLLVLVLNLGIGRTSPQLLRTIVDYLDIAALVVVLIGIPVGVVALALNLYFKLGATSVLCAGLGLLLLLAFFLFMVVISYA